MDLWKEIKKLEGRTLQTLGQGRPFIVSRVSHDLVTIKDLENKERSIHWTDIQSSWDYLRKYKTLTREEIMSSYSRHNAAYIVAILATIRGVSYREGPITLLLNRE